MALVFERKFGERFMLETADGLVTIQLLEPDLHRSRQLGRIAVWVDAPQSIRVDREEVYLRRREERSDGN